MSAYPPIHDYALIGDCRTAALVSNAGSIDWLCLPRFDSASFFNRLLDWEQGGYCAIRPTGAYRAGRRYREETVILETDFVTDDGHVRLTDVMPVAPEADRQARLLPMRQLLRRIEGLAGRVEIEIVVKLRPDHRRGIPVFRRRTAGLYCADLGGQMVLVATDAALDVDPGVLTGRVVLAAGRSLSLWITYSEDGPAVYPLIAEARRVIEETGLYWKGWVQGCSYRGPYRASVVRSALTLKLLTYAPSGAMVAAPTTSLPERLGGNLNWDYRYCWLRDASFTAEAFIRLGFRQEAWAFAQWLTHATTLTYPHLQVMYDVHGESCLPERIVPTFEGYGKSQPVRVGNAASSQFQLDIYGELLAGLWACVHSGYPVDRDTRQWILRMGNLVTERWSRPDHGMWETRDAPSHYVHSKVMCWVALDRAERLLRHIGHAAPAASGWTEVRARIQRVVLTTGFSTARRSFVQMLGGNHVDASALLFSAVGFIDGRDPRMLSTIAAIRRILGAGPFLYRYRLEQDHEGAFLPCSFWLAEALMLAGRRDEAQALIEQLQGSANDVGLFPEEISPKGGTALGNFPLALTHVAHLAAVLSLSQGR